MPELKTRVMPMKVLATDIDVLGETVMAGIKDQCLPIHSVRSGQE